MRNLTQILILLLLFCGCKKAEDRECWKAKGDIISVERDLPSFNKLILNDGIDYRFIQDSLDYVVVQAGENLINFIDTKVEAEVLTISDNNNCAFLRKFPIDVFVEIHFTSIDEVYNTSFGRIDGSIHKPNGFFQWDNWEGSTYIDLQLNLDSTEFALHTGAPTFVGHGAANLMYLFTSGVCHIDCSDLAAQSGQAHNAGIGNIRVNVEDGWLNCVVESYGNVYHSSNYGTLTIEDRGDGEIIQY